MKTLKKNMNKWDLILVTAFLSIAAISFIGYRIIHQAPAVTVEISSFGQVVETVDISKDGTYEIPNALGGFNTITVKDGSRQLGLIKEIVEKNSGRAVPKWLEVNRETMEAKIVAVPEREDIDLDIEETLIVELYSK